MGSMYLNPDLNLDLHRDLNRDLEMQEMVVEKA
jgi:hypothetical protein